jgi:predicted ribosome quality control (RQC) complex YloA/Tae2 family protein
MTSVDVAALLPELDVLIGAKLEKAYQVTPVELRIKLTTQNGKHDLVIEAGKRLHLTSTPTAAPAVPPSFPMLLRKELKGGRISSIAQYDFDRVVEIQFVRGDDERYLICELFSKGNVILTDESKRIILPLRGVRSATRQVVRGQQYEYPATQLSPVDLSYDEFEAAITPVSRDVVRTLATRFNMGGLYAEEACLKAEVEKSSARVSSEEVQRLYVALRAVFDPLRSNTLKPHIVCESESAPIDVLPFEVSQFDRYEKHYFGSFNQALDVYYGLKIEEQATAPASQARLQKIIDRQKAAIQQFNDQERENKSNGDLLFEKYQEIDRLIKTVREARRSKTWDEVSRALASFSFFKQVDQSTGTVTIEVGGVLIEVIIDMDVPQNAQKYYEKAKVMKAKAEGAERALMLSLKKMDEEKGSETKKTGPEKRRVKKKTRWYERYRWFFSTEGFLVIGGRDADTNEDLVKKYLEPRDIFLHADVHGAPAVIVKTDGKEISEPTLHEAAQFAVSYSAIWKQGLSSGRCYWVHPDQVSKTPESGEHVPKGAFIIRGERHYLESRAQLAVGILDDKIVGGPVSAITRVAQLIVVLEPGKYNPSDLAKMISRELLAAAPEDEKKNLRKIITVDQIVKFLPAGYSEISRFELGQH